MQTALLGVGAFVFVIVFLVAFLMVARSYLVNTADVKIFVNGDHEKPIIAKAGSTLLNTLAAEKIFIPSACGGGWNLRCMQGERGVRGRSDSAYGAHSRDPW